MVLCKRGQVLPHCFGDDRLGGTIQVLPKRSFAEEIQPNLHTRATVIEELNSHAATDRVTFNAEKVAAFLRLLALLPIKGIC